MICNVFVEKECKHKALHTELNWNFFQCKSCRKVFPKHIDKKPTHKNTIAQIKKVLKRESEVIWNSYQRVLEALARLEELEEFKRQ